MIASRKPTLLGLLVSLICAWSPAAHAEWSAAWQAPQSDAFLSLPLHQATVREIITTHAGGQGFRVRFSNQYGTGSVKIGAASVGVSAGGAALAGDAIKITFNGQLETELAPGQSLYSDPVAMPIQAMNRLAVSIYVRNAVLSASRHFTGNEYVWTVTGDETSNASGERFKMNGNALVASSVLIDRLDVLRDGASPLRQRVVATFGDSITDGFVAASGVPLIPGTSAMGKDARYPDFLQRRALAAGLNTTFVSAAIGGNRLISGPFLPMSGPSGVSRLERDVMTLPGVTDALILIGINDLGLSLNPGATGESLAKALASTIQRLHGANIRVVVGTLLPSSGAFLGLLYGGQPVDTARQKLNTWIKTSGVPDGVIDFDACLRDPASPSRLLSAYDSSDHLHPNADGYAAMANCVDLGLFR